jgi:hypothetical protein
MHMVMAYLELLESLVEDHLWEIYRSVKRLITIFTGNVKTPMGNVVQDLARVLMATVVRKQVSGTSYI